MINADEKLVRPLIVYLGPMGFPEGGAAARRILGISLALTHANYDVLVLSGQMPSQKQIVNLPPGISVISAGERYAESLPRFLRRALYIFMGSRTIRALRSQKRKPVAIILYSGYSPYLLRLIPYCRSNDIPLVFDAVEWYQQQGFLRNLLSPYQININLAMRILVPLTNGVIAISNYLESYYAKKGLLTTRIPPTLNVAALPARLSARRSLSLRLVYAGSPGTKDSLDEIVEAVLSARDASLPVELHVAGIQAADLVSFNSLKSKSYGSVPNFIMCYGTLGHSEALDLVRQGDFTVLLRRDDRVSRAGFSTKIVESLAVGTPVIANITGDLGDYLVHDENALICEGGTSVDLLRNLVRACELDEEEYLDMRRKARQTAERKFDASLSVDQIRCFLRDLR